MLNLLLISFFQWQILWTLFKWLPLLHSVFSFALTIYLLHSFCVLERKKKRERINVPIWWFSISHLITDTMVIMPSVRHKTETFKCIENDVLASQDSQLHPHVCLQKWSWKIRWWRPLIIEGFQEIRKRCSLLTCCTVQ